MKKYLTILILLFSAGFIFGQWIQQSSPTKKDLLDIKFFENRGVIVGDSVVLTSNDSGKTWKAHDVGEYLFRCAFQSKDTVWSVSFYDKIIKSTDGGESWETVNIDSSSNFKGYKESVFFLDNMHGWIGGQGKDYGYILRTENGGQTWQKAALDSADIWDISFVDTLSGWACSWSNGGIYKSTDGGKSWELNTRVTTSGGVYSEPLRRISFTTKDSGWTVGGISGDQITARTTDGGMNWIIVNQSTYGSSLHGLWFTDSKNGWTVGGSNAGLKILHTTDGGVNWSLQTQPFPIVGSIFYFESVYMFNLNTGFVVGDSGAILKTNNGNSITAIKNNLSNSPGKFELFQNYPNPFNPLTKINYNLQSGSFVILKIYDNLGRELKTLINNYQNAGLHSVTFNGKDLPSGIYYYQMEAGDFSQTKKLLLLK